MHIRATGLVLILALGAASACGYGDSGGGFVGGTVTFPMNASNGSGVSGTGRIDDDPGNSATVTVELQNAPPGAHAGHVHLGSCAQQGPILFELNPITPDAAGNGSAVTGGVPDVFLSSAYDIEYHVAVNPPGDPIACADIP